MKSFLDCWIQVATGLLPQALAGEPELVESLPRPMGEGAFGFAAVIAGEEQGRFSILLSGSILEAPLLGEGVDQKSAWGELLRETVEASAGELLASTGRHCRVESFEEIAGESKGTSAFELKSGERSWPILVRDAVKPPEREEKPAVDRQAQGSQSPSPSVLEPPSSAMELLLDVELETSLRFGSRELPLSDILELGPGDVVQLDRHVNDPVDLIVGDKIVARGEVVLVNGNFGLRVTEVAAPRKRLESIRCLF